MLQSEAIQAGDFVVLAVMELEATAYQNCCKFFLPKSETCESA